MILTETQTEKPEGRLLILPAFRRAGTKILTITIQIPLK
jgi:hypothetical protein